MGNAFDSSWLYHSFPDRGQDEENAEYGTPGVDNVSSCGIRHDTYRSWIKTLDELPGFSLRLSLRVDVTTGSISHEQRLNDRRAASH